MSGTEWVAPGQGSRFGDLRYEFCLSEMSREYGRASRAVRNVKETDFTRTNLRLTGASITEVDWARLESATFKVGA